MIPFIVAGIITLALPAGIFFFALTPFPTAAYLLGVSVSLINGLLAYITNRLSIGQELNTFMLRAALGHGTRLALIAGFIAGAILNDYPQLKAMLGTLGIGYISFLLSEIAMLHSRLYSARSIFR